jgi:hypothetical protein
MERHIPVATPSPAPGMVVTASPFDPLEMAVVQIGMYDPVPHLTGQGLLMRLCRTIFGVVPAQPLSNPRLEALRVLVLSLRRHGRNPQDAVEAALAGGVTQSQVDHLLESLCPEPVAKPGPQASCSPAAICPPGTIPGARRRSPRRAALDPCSPYGHAARHGMIW